MESKRILEALKLQPLSEEEKTRRHILGRLWGPIATCKETTRNGRLYNEELWNRVLDDELFQEKVANKGLLLELGHPSDGRETLDIEKACACIPEIPKIINGDLYAYVDIIDNAHGRALKTLVDYGFIPGISSRGSGDLINEDMIDPETFYLETWDIVNVPAVKKARLQVCESLDPKAKKLKTALKESLNKATAEDRAIMEQALKDLNYNLEEDDEEQTAAEANNSQTLFFNSEAECAAYWDGVDIPDNIPEVNHLFEDVEEDIEAIENETDETKETTTVGDLENAIKDADPETPVEMNITVDGEETEVSDVTIDVNEDTIKVGVDCAIVTDEDKKEEAETEDTEDDETEKVSETEEDEVNSDDESVAAETDENAEEAVDDGDDEVLESLKEMIRQKDALAEEVKLLRSEKSVGDAKEKKLEEELMKYKTAFARASELASKATVTAKENKDLKLKNESLSEALSQKNTQINELNSKLEKHISLTEDINVSDKKVKTLNEELATVRKEHEAKVAVLKQKLTESINRTNENAKIAKAYKDKYTKVMETYIANKASMLGVRPTEITSQLNENYSINDVEKVCDALLESGVNYNRLQIGENTKIRINESKTQKAAKNDNWDGLEDLIALAGLD